MSEFASPSLLAPLFSSEAMRAIVNDRARLQRMLDFESALARAEGALGVISPGASREIADACKADRYDIAAIGLAAVPASNLAIPVVNALTAEVAKRDKEASGYVHWGATSQDVIDTALVLELRAAIDAMLTDLDRATKAFTTLTGRLRRTMTLARTLMQQALPMPFGLKLAGYAAALARSRDRLRRLRKEALVLQFGGAAGTLAALGGHGLDVSQRLGALLDLPVPDAPWHTHRDRLAEVASAFAILAGTCGKIARDVALLMQNEVQEAFEPAAPSRGGSSTMPHKRNPVAATAALSAAIAAPGYAATILSAQVQEHERALGGWQAEWITFPALTLVTSGALAAVVDIAEGLEVDVERMKTNLERTGGAVFAEAVSFALAEKLGKADAHALTHELTLQAHKEKRSFQDVIAADSRVQLHIKPAELARLFTPTSYQGLAQTFIDRLIASAQGRANVRTFEGKPPVKPEAKPETRPETKPEPVAEAKVEPVPAAQPEPAEAKPQAVAEVEAVPSPPVPAAETAAEPAPAVAPAEPVPAAEPRAEDAPATAAEAPATPQPSQQPQPAKPKRLPNVEDDAPGALLQAFARVAEKNDTARSNDK